MIQYYNVNQFSKKIEKCESIICIGIGKRFEIMIRMFQDGVVNKIIAAADNNINKHGIEYDLGKRSIHIESIESALKKRSANTLIIISCTFYSEIAEQLQSMIDITSTDIVCFSHIYAQIKESEALEKRIPDDLRFTSAPVIPKMIHYCWFGGNPIPKKYKEWMNSWKTQCPDYEIIEWNESNYDITQNRYMYQAYQSKMWGFVPDYARLDIIYTYGGIYLDTDVELIRNLDHMLYQDGFAGFESNQYVALGLGFGAKKGHSLIKEMMEEYDNISFINEKGELNLVASPVIQTKFFLKKGLIQNGNFQVINGINIYPEKTFCAKSVASRMINPTSYSCSIHHYEATWKSEKYRIQSMKLENDMNSHYGYLKERLI